MDPGYYFLDNIFFFLLNTIFLFNNSSINRQVSFSSSLYFVMKYNVIYYGKLLQKCKIVMETLFLPWTLASSLATVTEKNPAIRPRRNGGPNAIQAAGRAAATRKSTRRRPAANLDKHFAEGYRSAARANTHFTRIIDGNQAGRRTLWLQPHCTLHSVTPAKCEDH